MTAAAVDIAGNLGLVRERVAAACERVGKDAAAVTLVGVTKGQPASAVVAAVRAGLRDVGENRVQEALPKMAEVGELMGGEGPRWHMVGHLQTNKVKAAVGAGFAILHAVDSGRLLRAIAERSGERTRVMIQVNVSGETTKHGCAPGEVGGLVAEARGLGTVEVVGLMTVAPRARDAEEVRPVFRSLAALARKHGLAELSMGMTEDFEVAIEEGATHVRIGRAIFGERNA